MSKTKDTGIKIAVEFSRILLGITFIFSGFVKSVDPLGTVYKIQDYLTDFGLTGLHDLALPMSIVLCAGEFCLGMFMLIGLYRKWTSRVMLLVMLFMTPLTLYVAIANPVHDCGCFGDALIISNWATFFKNIPLLACAIVTFVYHQKITNLFTGKFYWFVGLWIVVFSLAFCLYNYYGEPILDFRPYKPGNNIPELMTVEDAKAPVYKNVLVYEKDGVKKEFDDNNYPWQDSTWVFVDRTSKLIKEGEQPVITDFAVKRLFFNSERTQIESEEEITTELLADTGYTFLMIAYSLDDMDKTYLSNFEDVDNYAQEYGYGFYCLTASPQQTIIEQEKEDITNFKFCSADERLLKTVMRSDPGLLLLKGGTVINKWTGRDTPDESLLKQPIEKLSISKIPDTREEDKHRIFAFALILLIPIVGTKLFDALIYQRRPYAEPQKRKKEFYLISGRREGKG